MKRDFLIALALVLVAGTTIGVLALIAHFYMPEDTTETIKPRTEPVVQLSKKEEPKKFEPRVIPPAKKIAEKRIEKKEEPKVEAKKPTAPVKEDRGEPKVEPKVEPKIEPKIEPKKEVKPAINPKVIVLDPDVKINDPDGEFRVDTLNKGKKLVLQGKVKTLIIRGANGGSFLDASLLEAHEIVIAGNINSGATVKLGKAMSLKIADVNDRSVIDASLTQAHSILLAGAINGGSTVKLSAAPNGSVVIAGEVNDRGQLEIDAPEGKVLLNSRNSSCVNGNAKVRIVAREVELRGAVNGPKTHLDVTLTKAGSLKFERLHGGVELSWRKADAADPEPRIDAGEVNPSAILRKAPTE